MPTTARAKFLLFTITSVLAVFLLLLVLAEVFAFEEYKPSRLVFNNSQPQPPAQVASAQENLDEIRSKKILVNVYFTTRDLLIGSCRSTVVVKREISTYPNSLRERLNALFAGPTELEKNDGFISSFQGWQKVFLGTILQKDGTLFIRFSSEVTNPDSKFYLGQFDNECGRGVWQQIYLTAKEDERVKYVVFMVDDDPSVWNKFITKFDCSPKAIDQNNPDLIWQRKQCATKR